MPVGGTAPTGIMDYSHENVDSDDEEAEELGSESSDREAGDEAPRQARDTEDRRIMGRLSRGRHGA